MVYCEETGNPCQVVAIPVSFNAVEVKLVYSRLDVGRVDGIEEVTQELLDRAMANQYFARLQKSFQVCTHSAPASHNDSVVRGKRAKQKGSHD